MQDERQFPYGNTDVLIRRVGQVHGHGRGRAATVAQVQSSLAVALIAIIIRYFHSL